MRVSYWTGSKLSKTRGINGLLDSRKEEYNNNVTVSVRDYTQSALQYLARND